MAIALIASVLVDVESAGLGCREQLLVEVGLKRAQPLVHRLELRLLRRRKLGARMQELLVIDVEQLREVAGRRVLVEAPVDVERRGVCRQRPQDDHHVREDGEGDR